MRLIGAPFLARGMQFAILEPILPLTDLAAPLAGFAGSTVSPLGKMFTFMVLASTYTSDISGRHYHLVKSALATSKALRAHCGPEEGNPTASTALGCSQTQGG